MLTKYLIRKNGKYLSELFVDDIRNKGFKTTNPSKAYWYDIKEIASNIANNLGAECVEVNADTLTR